MSEPRTRTKYTYDALGRLSTTGTTGSSGYAAWGLSWTYDRYGNRTAQTVTAGSAPSDSLTVSTTTNRVTGTGFSYDAGGNMTQDGLNTMTYDAARHLLTSSNGTSSGAYAYDGKGMRIKKCVPNCSSPTTTTLYIFAGGKVLAEYDNGAAVGSPSREYIYSGGTQIAKIAGATTTYYHQDHLSNRLVTNSSGGAVEQMGHLPYGESWYDTGSEKWSFTSYERDAESGNDYAMARYDVNRLGRFASPDPLSGSTANPQSLNHYTYVGNDPINATDPTGQDPIYAFGYNGNCTHGEGGHVYTMSCGPNDPAFDQKGPGTGDDFGWATGSAGDNYGFNTDPNATPDNTDMNALGICTQGLFGVTTVSFTASVPGQDGSFTGAMGGVYQGFGRPLGVGPSVFTVTNNDTFLTTWGLTRNYNISAAANPDSGLPQLPPGSVGGLTNDHAPFANVTASNMSAADIAQSQIFELGNSLGFITGRQLPAPGAKWNVTGGAGENEPGSYLENCYNAVSAAYSVMSIVASMFGGH